MGVTVLPLRRRATAYNSNKTHGLPCKYWVNWVTNEIPGSCYI